MMYKPTQNGKTKTAHTVQYVEVQPPSELQSLVYCYWELKTDESLPQDFYYHVLPDACVDIILNRSKPQVATIMTPHTTSEVLNLGKKFHYVGIRFLPGVWQNNLHKIVGSYIDTSHIGSVPVSKIGIKFTRQNFPLQQPVLSRIVQRIAGEKMVTPNSLVANILINIDNIHSVVDMAATVNMSPRQLQRTLPLATGFAPHDFLKVLRMQQSFGQHYLAFYADQSHFIHSFRKITGYTPARYAQKFDV